MEDTISQITETWERSDMEDAEDRMDQINQQIKEINEEIRQAKREMERAVTQSRDVYAKFSALMNSTEGDEIYKFINGYGDIEE